MAVTLNAVMAAGNQGDTHAVATATSLSTTGLTIAAGTNRVLVVVIGWEIAPGGGTPGSRTVTWNGVTVTEVAFITAAASPSPSVGIYVLVNPATGAQTLAVSWTTSLDCYLGALCFDGADQTTGINAANTVTQNAGLTMNVTGTSDGATVCTHLRNGSVPAGAGTGNTLFWDYDALNPGGGGGYRIGLTGANAYDFNSGSNTGTQRATAGVNVIVAAAGGATTRGTPFGHEGTAFTGGRTFHGILQRSGLWLPRRVNSRLSGMMRTFARGLGHFFCSRLAWSTTKAAPRQVTRRARTSRAKLRRVPVLLTRWRRPWRLVPTFQLPRSRTTSMHCALSRMRRMRRSEARLPRTGITSLVCK